jgi:hypothetical protein
MAAVREPQDILRGHNIVSDPICVRGAVLGLVMGCVGLIAGRPHYGVPIMMMIKAICDRVEDLKPVGELLGK